MKQCPNGFEWELYLDGELPRARREELAGHLADCPDCGGLVEDLRRESALLAAALAATPLPPGLAAAIERRLAAAENGEGWLRLFLPALGLTGMLVALVAGWWPLFEKLGVVVRLLGGEEMLPRLVYLTAKLIGGLA